MLSVRIVPYSAFIVRFPFVEVIMLAVVLTISTFAGTGEKGFAGDGGPAAAAKLDQPFDVAFDRAGHLYFSDTFNHRIRKVDAKTGVITTVAGNGKKGYGGDGGAATAAMLNEPYGVELDADGNLFIVDRLNYCIRKVDAKGGTISTVAGTGGRSGYGGDGGPADKAGFKEPNGLCLDGKGKLYVADVADQRVRVIDLKSGVITTLAGNGTKASAGDGGPLAKATFAGPRAVAVGPDKCLYVVEREGNSVRKIDLATQTITRFAGTGKKGYTGDGGPAKDATFDGPKEIDIDKNGNVYAVDTENEAIRRIDANTGVVTTVAGKGRTKTPGLGDGGPATAATLGRPHGVAVGPDGAIYIGDTNSHRIRRVK
jgi:DNA-binding beta-propeller fold protein YncE